MPCANLVASALLGPEASTTRFVPLVGDGQSVATGKFRPRSPDEQSKRGAGNQRQDTVPFLSYAEEQKLRFQGEKPLRSAARLLPPGSRKVAGPVPLASASRQRLPRASVASNASRASAS